MEVIYLPNIKSAERRVRVEAKANLRNRTVKSELKTLSKKFEAAVAEGNKEQAQALFKEYTGALDKAKLKGTLHRNSIDRKKAHIAKALNSLS